MTYEIQVRVSGGGIGAWKTVARRDDKEVAEHYARLAEKQHHRRYRVIAVESAA